MAMAIPQCSPTCAPLPLAHPFIHAAKTSTRPPSWSASLPVGLGSTLHTGFQTTMRLRPSKALKGGIEPDLPEDDRDDYRTAGEAEEDSFPYGYADGHHTWHEGDDGTFWEGIKEVFESAGGPSGGQAVLAWSTLPILYVGLAYGVQVEYLFIGMALFIFAFIGIEMAKPAKDNEFPPEVYMQLRKKRMSDQA